MIALQRCTCGGKAKLRRGLPNMGNSKTVWAFVQCLSCGMRTPTLYPKGNECVRDLAVRAAERWNKAVSHGN